ncbi:MAG: abortive infection family protein [Acidimicrobiia bacterium]|nr:abortive infection family protein [Acidimicrobiia bacterium]
MFDLTRPNCVDADEWRALSALDDRLSRALRDHDAELMLGTAKELCEAVAKVTCQQRGEPFTPLADMPDLINQAHRLVDRLPAEAGAAGGAVRNIAQTAMKLAKQLNELRNQAGSGHGRPTPTGLDEIDGRFAASTALIWCRWMLGRLDALVANDPDRLVGDISRQVFSRGTSRGDSPRRDSRRWSLSTSLRSASPWGSAADRAALSTSTAKVSGPPLKAPTSRRGRRTTDAASPRAS